MSVLKSPPWNNFPDSSLLLNGCKHSQHLHKFLEMRFLVICQVMTSIKVNFWPFYCLLSRYFNHGFFLSFITPHPCSCFNLHIYVPSVLRTGVNASALKAIGQGRKPIPFISLSLKEITVKLKVKRSFIFVTKCFHLAGKGLLCGP